MTRHDLPELAGVLTAAEVLDTAGTIAELQLPERHDPLVPRRPLRPVEPRRDGHGPRRGRPAPRGRAGLPVAGRRPAPRRLVARLLRGRRRRGRQARHQRVRLRRRRRLAPLADHRRPRVHAGAVADGASGPSTGCSTSRRRGARSSGPATSTASRGATPCSPARRRSSTRCAAPCASPSWSARSGPTGSCRR